MARPQARSTTYTARCDCSSTCYVKPFNRVAIAAHSLQIALRSTFSFALARCSTKKSVPISLLIMSRAFTLQAPDPAKALAQSISAMDDDVVTEVRRNHPRCAHDARLHTERQRPCSFVFVDRYRSMFGMKGYMLMCAWRCEAVVSS